MLIGNYDVKRCYLLDVTFHYLIPGGVTNDTIVNITQGFSSLFQIVYSLHKILPQCSAVLTTTGNVTSSSSGMSLISFKVPLTFTASNSTADDQVSLNLITCINTASSHYKVYLDTNSPRITQHNVTYATYNTSTISTKRSCCGGDIPPPCCAVGSINVSSTECGKCR